LAARLTVICPWLPSVTVVVPAATGCPAAVVNAGHEIRRVPVAGCPVATYTVSLTVVNAGAAANIGLDTHNINHAAAK
jgi:hypothetical protein